MDPPLYTKYAWLYDIIYKKYIKKTVPKIIDFVEHVFSTDAERQVEKILDLACGTGGPTLELARRGYIVVGVDLSEEMIQIARNKAEKQGLSNNVSFIVQDMTKIDYREEFDAVTLFFTSINYVLSDDDIQELFKRVYRALKPGGVFIADTLNILTNANRLIEGIPVHWRIDIDDKNIVVLDTVLMDSISQIINWNRTIILQDKESVKIIPDKHVLRGYTGNELKLLARNVGFKKIVIYGDYNTRKKDKGYSNKIVLVAVK